MTTGQLTPDDIITFLTARGITDPMAYDGHFPETPDRQIGITIYGGTGFTEEQAFDNIAVQFHIRGDANDDSDALALAWQIDYALIPPPLASPVTPGSVGTQRVLTISRTGGPPAKFAQDQSRRSHYSGNYLFKVARA